MSKCNLCGEKVDFQNGGIALMTAFVHGCITSLSNVAICGRCYKEYGIDEDIRKLNKSARLGIEFLGESKNE